MQVIRNFLERHNINDNVFALGVSGGADSLALALMFREECPNCRLIALTVDHGLRPTSLKEAHYVADIMERFGIEHHILTWEGDKPKTGIEEQARIARYELLFDWCKKHHVCDLAIAHHLYDQAETFLMRLQRGSGLYGLAAMDEVSVRNGILILRPFLNTRPEELKDFLQRRKISWVEDESNSCEDFLRVRMRRFLPFLERETGISPERLVMAVVNLQKAKGFIETIAQDIIADKIHFWGESGASVDYAEFLSWHDELKFYILGNLIKRLGERDYIPEAQKLLNLLMTLENDEKNGVTLGGCLFIRCGLRLFIIKEYRDGLTEGDSLAWEDFLIKNPEARGIQIPYKLRVLLMREKLLRKK